MYFIFILLISLSLPLFFRKAKNTLIKWLPSLFCLFTTIVLAVKVYIFPSPEMAILADILYMMTAGLATLGAIVGAIIVQLTK
ncbi:hypothetical protein FZW96_13650 [Bacillus sp. BGMRC 2118]|nr:hypothetical protein FZW96_13650 [Bacillus sp. BGMRC 2118]